MTSQSARSIVLAATLLSVTVALAEESKHIRRDYVVDVAIVSQGPSGTVDSSGWHGSGMASNGATVGFSVKIDDKRFSADFKPYLEEGRPMLAIDVQPESTDLSFEPLEMSSLRPLAISLGKDKKGRVYQANITPRVRVIDSTPQDFVAEELRLHNWSFPSCTVLLNDSVYVGRISCSSSPVAFLEVCDVAKVEFSLQEVAGWEPWGLLSKGTVVIRHPQDETTIEIAGVRHGNNAIELPGGPYKVWVNWSASELTAETLRQQLLAARERIAKGDLYAKEGALARLDKQLARELGPWAVSSGVRGYQRGEKVRGRK